MHLRALSIFRNMQYSLTCEYSVLRSQRVIVFTGIWQFNLLSAILKLCLTWRKLLIVNFSRNKKDTAIELLQVVSFPMGIMHDSNSSFKEIYNLKMCTFALWAFLFLFQIHGRNIILLHSIEKVGIQQEPSRFNTSYATAAPPRTNVQGRNN